MTKHNENHETQVWEAMRVIVCMDDTCEKYDTEVDVIPEIEDFDGSQDEFRGGDR